MKRIAVALVAVVAALLSFAGGARAQSYAVRVPSVLLEAWVEPDGKVTLDYTFEIANEPDARSLDGVDFGMPTTQWDLAGVRAWLDDAPLDSIVSSPYVKNGLAANLPDGGLRPGQSGKVRVRIEGVGGLLFSDTSNDGFVSMRLTPTWFNGDFVRGLTFVRVVLHLPPGVPVSQLKWHAEKWIGQATIEADAARPEHAAVLWEKTYSFTGPWMLGVSFPRYAVGADGAKHALVGGVRDITTWDLFEAWAASPGVRGKAVFLFLLAFTVIFFWATRRTGCVVWGAGCVGLLIAFGVMPVLPILLAPLLPVAALLVRSARLRKKNAYMPAVASVEGGGIKRGLTAPEAACLLGVPPGKILVLVLYGLSRKGLVELEDGKDGKGLMARAVTGFGISPQEDLAKAAEKSTVIQPYESAFLALLHGGPMRDVASIDWRAALKGVANHAASRLTSYDLEQTREYYKQIVARAWKEASTVGDVTLRQESVDRNFDWLVLDDGAWDRMDRWHRAGWRYRNPWLPGGRTVPAGIALPGSAPKAGGPPPLPTPSAADVAGSLGGKLEGLSGSFASALGVGGSSQGLFSGVDKVSADVFKSIVTEMAKSSSGRSGGGGGFSCACACAGCACACACAGGGR